MAAAQVKLTLTGEPAEALKAIAEEKELTLAEVVKRGLWLYDQWLYAEDHTRETIGVRDALGEFSRLSPPWEYEGFMALCPSRRGMA